MAVWGVINLTEVLGGFGARVDLPKGIPPGGCLAQRSLKIISCLLNLNNYLNKNE